MGTVFRKAWTAPLPPGAEVATSHGKRVARWRLRNGKLRTAEVFEGRSGTLRIRGRTAAYIAKYRDGNGVWVEVATGCKDVTAARSILAQLERRAELIRAGVLTTNEDVASRHSDLPIADHIELWKKHLQLRGSTKHWWTQAKRRVTRVCQERGIRRLRDLTVDTVERWLREQTDAGMSAGTRNGYRRACVSFANWCVRTNRLVTNPITHVATADEHTDRRRTRRALTTDELDRLLDAARRRPLVEAMTVRRGKDKGKQLARVTVATRDQLDRIGRERALIYKTLVLTGLRKGELASITVSQLDFTGPVAHAVLEAKDEKNRRGSQIPLRADLAAELRAWLTEKLNVLQNEARRHGDPIPSRFPADTKMLNVPTGLIRIFNRDLVFAGIARIEKCNGKNILIKTDERGRTIDIHALRHTFGTHLSKAGVSLRTAQAAMRHSDPSLTANVYTDPKLLDVAGALEALPKLMAVNGFHAHPSTSDA
jgi:integrase